MKAVIAAILVLLIQGCASPRAWVQAITPSGGIIGYQNYNPSSDNGARINALISCPSHRMVWSGLKSSATAPAYYMTNNFIVPLSENIQWAEYHYECTVAQMSEVFAQRVEAAPKVNGIPKVPEKLAQPAELAFDPLKPPLAASEYDDFLVTLNDCVQRSAAQVACNATFKNKNSMGSAKRLSVSSTYIEQQNGRSQDKVISILNGLASPIAWHSGRFCTIQPLGSCNMSLIYSGVNLLPGKYSVNFRLYVGALGSRSLISLIAEHK